MGDNLRHAQYNERGSQIDDPQLLLPELPGDSRIFSPQQYDPSAGTTYGVADDTDAVLWAYAQAVKYRGALNIGGGFYRMKRKLPLSTTPVTISGISPQQSGFIVDPELEGDLISFSDTWFSSADVDQSTTSIDIRNQKQGVNLYNFSVIGYRTTTKTQNGIVFYNRNDNFRIISVEVVCVKGYGIAASGPSTLSPAKSWAREFFIYNCQTRWCGDSATGRPAFVVDSDNWQAGDDSVNLAKLVGIKSIFSDGMAFSMDARTAATAQMTAIELDLIVEGGQNLSASVPAVLLKGGIKSSNIKLTFGSLQRGTNIYCLKIDQNAIGQKLDESILDLHFGSVDYGVNVVVAKNVKCFLRAANSSVLDIKIQALTGYFEVDVVGGSSRVKQPIVDIAVGARSLCAIRHPAKVVTTAVLATIPATTYVNHSLIVTDAASGQKLKYSDGATWVTVT
jgi:hypothetical protein